MDYVDIFTIIDTIKSEAGVLDGLGRLGLTDEQASSKFNTVFIIKVKEVVYTNSLFWEGKFLSSSHCRGGES